MSPSELDAIREQLLVMRVQSRDPSSFPELVALYERRILYYIRRLLGDDSEGMDVLQEIWMKVFLRINTLRVPQAFRVWLYKIAHDVAVSHLRKLKSMEVGSLTTEQLEDLSGTSDWNELDLLDQVAELHQALGQLTLPHREVLTLRFLEDLDLAQIAEVVGCGIGTVKSRLHYAKLELRKILESPRHD